MRPSGLIVLLTAVIISTVCRASPLRFYLPFDGDCTPAVTPIQRAPVIRGMLEFRQGIKGKALLIGGKNGPSVTFFGTEYVNTNRGTATFWVQAIDWDSTEEIWMTYFRFPPHAFLYHYPGFADQMSFYCKFPHYDRYYLPGGALPLRKGKWFHVAVTWADEVLMLYTNGKRVGAHHLREPMRREWHGQGVAFGCSSSGHALIDEFRIYDLPMSEPEVQSLIQKPQDATPSNVYAVYYPGVQKVRVWIYANAEKARVSATCGHSKALHLGEITSFADGVGRGIFELPGNVPTGLVRVSADIFNTKGESLGAFASAPFEKRVYPWQAEAKGIGISDEVVPPFTPLTVNGTEISCWGRTYRFGPDVWLHEIVSRGQQMLAAPVQLHARANGKDLMLKPEESCHVVSAKPGVVRLKGASRCEALTATVEAMMEYDGFVKYDLTLKPDAPLPVQALHLDIPIRNENAVLYHACRDAIRITNEAGYIPMGKGKVWGSSYKKSREVLGTFLPYFWIGDYDRGLCWMCDTDRGWSVPDEQDCVEFLRQGPCLTARIHFITKEKVLTQPWHVTFGLMAGPPRPEPEGWRMAAMPGNAENLPKPASVHGDKLVLNWYCGIGESIATSQGYGKPPDMDKFRKMATKYREQHGAGWGVNTSPNDLWFHPNCDENEYFQLEWRPGHPRPERNDFVAYTIDRLMAEKLVDGLYSDDTYPVACANLITDCGYVREDGKVQLGYSLFANRDWFKRLKYLHWKHGCKYGLFVHMTDAMIMPSFCFWDGKHDLEWGTRSKGDYIDNYPLGELCARAMSRQYGMAASWHTPAPGHGDDQATLCLLHDIIPRVYDMDNRTLPAKLLFGFGETDVEFLGYWFLQSERDPQALDVKISAWVRRTKMTAMLVAGNLSNADWSGRLQIPLEKLGLPADVQVVDGEEGHSTIPLVEGSVMLAIPRHNYRLLLLGPKGVFPRDLPPLGAELPRPKEIIKELCDDFSGPTLAPAWKLVASPVSDGAIEIYRGRLCVKGVDYKFAAAERPFGQDNVSVQVRVESHARSHQHRIGLALLWDKERYVFAGPNLGLKKFSYAYFASEKQKGGKTGSEVSLANPGNMHQYNWVKITLAPESIVFYASADGKNWTKDWEIPRPAELKGAPRVLRLGKNPDGAEAVHRPTASYDYFDDLIVGKETSK